MKYLSSKHWLVLLTLGCVTAFSGCSGDEQSDAASDDPARIEAAPESTKRLCEESCTALDEIRAKACGTAEFATHSACYAGCVTRYLDYPGCRDDFDQTNECIRDAVCSAGTLCVGDVIMAAACMQVSPSTG